MSARDPGEAARLAALDAYDILDTPPEDSFDEVAQLASAICGTPIAVVNLIGDGRQFFKAEVGLGVRSTPLESSFCAKAILEDEFLVVPDATRDPRFACNPLVTGDPNLRFYAGALLQTPEGHAIGTVCVLGFEPRELTPLQERTLRVLAHQVMKQLELRRALAERDISAGQVRDAAFRHAALLELGDRVRDLSDPAEISFAAAEVLGKALGVSRVGYGTIDKVQETITIERDWNAPGIRSLAGVLHFRYYGSYIEDLKRGETVVFADAEADPRTRDTAAALKAISAQAVVNMPLVEHGGFVALLYANHATARPWPDDELALMREVAERVRGAMERARQAAELVRLNETLEQKVEERTRERDRMWRLSTDVMLLADFEARIRAVNPAWTISLGWLPEELVGRDFMDLLHPDDADTTLAEVARLSDGITTLRFENRYRAKDGTYRWFSWTAVPEGGLIHAVGRDVQGEKEAAEERARLEDQLRQSQKMEAVGQLTGGLAHDFNNLLAGISGSLELMQTRLSQGRLNELDRYVTAAQGATKRAAALTHRLLAFSRRQTLDPKPTDVNRMVAGMEELVRRTVGPAIEVEVVAAGGLWPTLVDPPQLENALLNLCINARDAMPEGGRLTVETGNCWLDRRASAERDLPPGQYVSLCVSDTGSGMTPDVIAKAFDPFFTTKPIGQGTGLGLSMIYGFARQSGGQVRIYSEPGEGSMICIYLPRLAGGAKAVEAVPEFVDVPRAGDGETVLVVDDEPTVRMLVAEVLQELGYSAVEAADAPSGLKVLQSDTRIDLLVTDVGLPGGMNGRQMADAARTTRPDLKVLFITGYAENAAVGNGYLERGMEVLTKPFAMEALATRIREMISKSAA